MKACLDTHAFLLSLEADPQLGSEARGLITHEEPLLCPFF
jgi:hypothetical protein